LVPVAEKAIQEPNEATAPVAVVRIFPVAPNRGELTLREACDGYFAGYDGRDESRVRRLAFWVKVMGDVKLHALDTDAIADAIEHLASEHIRKYAGRDENDRAIFREHGRRSPATVNRYRQALFALLTWCVHKRLTPKGWQHPVRAIKSERENNARVRFLTPEERSRLLAASRLSAWPKLYLLVLIAITTKARRATQLAHARPGSRREDRVRAHQQEPRAARRAADRCRSHRDQATRQSARRRAPIPRRVPTV